MPWELIVKEKFSAAHFLRDYPGNCERMHGHTFMIEVHLSTSEVDVSGVSIDFKDIREYLRSILPDHQVLNEIFPFSPSAENLARHYFELLREKYQVLKVVIWESEQAAASYAGDS